MLEKICSVCMASLCDHRDGGVPGYCGMTGVLTTAEIDQVGDRIVEQVRADERALKGKVAAWDSEMGTMRFTI